MCRFIAYTGHPIVLHDILYKPKNSLIKQSIHAREIEEPLNGDGFGVSWYDHRLDSLPGVFKTIQPAWNDLNLETLSGKIYSECFLAHVRAASSGGASLFNTHPFVFKEYSFIHNGSIGGFMKIKRLMRRVLSDEIYDWLKGETDSEHFFALFLHFYFQNEPNFTLENCMSSLKHTLHFIHDLQNKLQVRETSYLNFVLSNGISLFVLRYISTTKEIPLSLHYSHGDRLEYEKGNCIMAVDQAHPNHAVLIASEKLSSHKMHWKDVPPNNALFVNEIREITLQAV